MTAAIIAGILNFILAVYGLYLLQIALSGLPRKMTAFPEAEELRHFAILIPARNEEAVIGRLLESIRQMQYPPELIDTFVIINNCTDRTEEIAREYGVRILKCDCDPRTKGDVLRYAFEAVGGADVISESVVPDGSDALSESDAPGGSVALDGSDALSESDAPGGSVAPGGSDAPGGSVALIGSEQLRKKSQSIDAYIIMDADNVFDPAFLKEMNNALASGAPVVQCRRTGLNTRKTWVSGCYEIYYAMQNAFFNHPRTSSGNSGSINGTGWAVTKDLIDRRGFNSFTLTEDYEFTIHCALDDERIVYCDKAVVYDQYVETLGMSMTQRVRWTYGILQCLKRYEIPLLKAGFSRCGRGKCNGEMHSGSKCSDEMRSGSKCSDEMRGGSKCSSRKQKACLDAAFLNFIPFAVTASFILPFLSYPAFGMSRTMPFLLFLGITFAALWIVLSLTALISVLKMHAGVRKNLAGILTYPLFMLSWVPVLFSFIFRRNYDWTPIRRGEG